MDDPGLLKLWSCVIIYLFLSIAKFVGIRAIKGACCGVQIHKNLEKKNITSTCCLLDALISTTKKVLDSVQLLSSQHIL